MFDFYTCIHNLNNKKKSHRGIRNYNNPCRPYMTLYYHVSWEVTEDGPEPELSKAAICIRVVILIERSTDLYPKYCDARQASPCPGVRSTLQTPMDSQKSMRGSPRGSLENLEKSSKIRTLFHRNISPMLLGFFFYKCKLISEHLLKQTVFCCKLLIISPKK